VMLGHRSSACWPSAGPRTLELAERPPVGQQSAFYLGEDH
jgi:hypothetical protein